MLAATIFIFGSVFLGVFMLVFAGATFGQSPSARLKARLKHLAEDDARHAAHGREELLGNEAPIYRLPPLGRMKTALERAGLTISPLIFLLWVCTGALACFWFLYLLRGNVVLAFPSALIVPIGAFYFLRHRRRQREERLTEQLPDALVMIARSLRAGHSLTGAVELVSEELPDPTGPLFRMAYEQQRLGMRMADSLAMLPEKINSMDLRFFVTIIRINSETGGNLGEILDKLAETIRSRLQIRRQVRVCTAEGRLSGYVLVVMPLAVFAMFYLVRPSYMDVFFNDRTCQLILAGAALAQVLGFLFIRKIVNIRI